MKKDRVYLDWAAATPLLAAAKTAMEPYQNEFFGNPSAIHAEGQVCRAAVEAARALVGQTLQVRPEFVTFTSGGTEGNNLAIMGVVQSQYHAGHSYSDITVITTSIEHPSVGATCAEMATWGVNVKYVNVLETGKIDLNHLRELLDESVLLVTAALINSEIGTMQPARAIAKMIHEAEQKYGTHIFLHLDAAQAPLWVNCQFDALGADFVTLDAAKCCGPKGVGMLIRSRRGHIDPVVYGGGQESGLRPGTENVAGVVGAATALQWAQETYKERAEQVAAVRTQSLAHLQAELPQLLVNGASGDERVANNINISIPGLDTEFAAVVLDKHGFAVSTKSACSGAGGGASTVVLETTKDSARAASTLRITLGPDTTLKQLKDLTTVLKEHVAQMKKI